jgi:hypothetical protein
MMADKQKKNIVNLISIGLEDGKFLRIDVNWKKFYKLDSKKWTMLRSEIAPWLFFRYLEKKYNKKNQDNTHATLG